MEAQYNNIFDEADAFIIGIGNEFAVDVEAVVSENPLGNRILNSRNMEGLIKEYVINSIYHHELVNNENKKIKSRAHAYEKILKKMDNKKYFVLTTCSDDLIFHATKDRDKIAAPCGSISRLQYDCECYKTQGGNGIEDGENILDTIYREIEQMGEKTDIDKISNLIPCCPLCRKPLAFNRKTGSGYNENGYIPQWEKYTAFLQRTLNKNLKLIELGVDFEVPTVIRWPFEKIAMLNYKARLYRINGKLPQLPEELKDKGISIHQNSVEFIEKVL